MALDGIAAVQARIQAIEQQMAGVSSSATATTSQAGSTGADFASLLSDAMNTQTASGLGDLGGASGSAAAGAAATSPGVLSSLLGEASALTGGSGGGTAAPDLSSLLSSLTGASTSGVPAPAGTSVPNATAEQFVNTALSQQGKPYVWGSSASPADASPASFDCSELTKWAAARAGVTIPDGAAHQYVWLKENGATMSVEQALRTPGALLFHFDSEPQPGLTGEPEHAHVAISLGNGTTIEARGHAYGVGVFDATNRFDYAGMIPGMT